jgi:hypothetical protein
MLKTVFSTAVFFVLSLFVLSAVQAQTDYTWETYGLSFTVPAGFSETANTDEKFEGTSDKAQIHLFGIYPINDVNLTEENLEEALIAMAAESGMDVQEAAEIEFNGFSGMYAEGEIEGVPTFFACMLDPNGELNFIVTIVHNNADAAIKIMKSITAE